MSSQERSLASCALACLLVAFAVSAAAVGAVPVAILPPAEVVLPDDDRDDFDPRRRGHDRNFGKLANTAQRNYFARQKYCYHRKMLYR